MRKKRGGLKERRPIPLPSYLDANAAMSVGWPGIREHAARYSRRVPSSVSLIRPAAIVDFDLDGIAFEDQICTEGREVWDAVL